ncbi:type II secretion system GspH family protein [Dethiosulfovibrio sp. F2B]|uniref:type II secretion system protein n=1 Tax=Dethiosulfovibrio faecalis TaxID=2720018 RepID=UPI001F3A36CC|nr:type II secretion system protein [Dethiosulfovibrio faecalis]MCF4150587.1 type II secretion system GspH family protein [Dethiosulfovibrio faecalis]
MKLPDNGDEEEKKGAEAPFFLPLRAYTLLEVLIVSFLLSVGLGSVFLVISGENWRNYCAKDEAFRMTRWLTNRYQRSIMYRRPFYLIISKHGIDVDRIGLTWTNPIQKEIFRLKYCIVSRLGPYSLSFYSPIYRTLSPGMTLNIYTDTRKAPLGKIVLPVKGFPYMRWFRH